MKLQTASMLGCQYRMYNYTMKHHHKKHTYGNSVGGHMQGMVP